MKVRLSTLPYEPPSERNLVRIACAYFNISITENEQK